MATTSTSRPSFFSIVELQFGNEAKSNMKKLLDHQGKLASLQNEAFFVNKCNSNGLLPQSYRHNFKNITQGVHDRLLPQLEESLRRKVMTSRAKSLYIRLHHQKTYGEKLWTQLNRCVSTEVLVEFQQNTESVYRRQFDEYKAQYFNKFEAIKAEEVDKYRQTHKLENKWIKNLTDKQVPTNVLMVLSLGEKFSVKQHLDDDTIIDAVARIEAAISILPENERQTIRCNTANILKNHKSAPKSRNFQEKLFLEDVKAAELFVKRNRDILVTKADKGSVTVLISQTEYHEKMMSMLSDTETYTDQITERTYRGRPIDIGITVQNKVNRYVEKQFVAGTISVQLASKLKSHSAVLPRAYGLVKIHKPGNPLRIIISSIKSATYNLAKYFSDVLSNVVGKRSSHVKHAKDFKEGLKNVRLPRNQRIFSLDVTALFTNISKKAVVQAIENRWSEIQEHTSMDKAAFIEGCCLVFDNCFFVYDGKKYKQVFGSPMGSPISPALADLVLEDLENQVLERLRRMGIHVRVYKRYVDDCFLIANARHIPIILRAFNSFDQEGRLKFTIEEEANQKLPFLDVEVTRNDNGTLSFDWYHKATWSGRYLNFKSFLPESYKRNTVSILAKKIVELSDEEFHRKNFDLLRETLQKNGYPEWFVRKHMAVSEPTTTVPTPTQFQQDPSNVRYMSFPYDTVPFGKIRALLEPYQIKVVGRAIKPLKPMLFSQLKDKVEFKQRSEVVYEIKCECGVSYVGQTGQYIEQRLQQHKAGRASHSSLSAHLIENGHNVTLDNVKILCTEPSTRVRLAKEAIYIQKRDRLNTQYESARVNDCFREILKLIDNPP